MDRRRLYDILSPDSAGAAARTFRAVHHVMVAAGLSVMIADTVAPWRAAYGGLLNTAFHVVAAFFVIEYAARLFAAPAAPGAGRQPAWRARLRWALSISGLADLLGALPGVLNVALTTDDSILFGFVWAFKLVRYAPGLVSLGRVISRARRPLLSVLLAFAIVLLAAASLAYLFERQVQPQAFGSIPAALWWAIVTMTTTGYGDAIPHTLFGRLLSGVVMIAGIMVLALWAGILASGFAEEIRREAFLQTWNVVAKVPFFGKVGASVIAEVTRILRPRDYPAGAVIVHRGEAGDCMYFIASGMVEIELEPIPIRLGVGGFFGEIALLTGEPRSATVVTVEPCTLLRLDIVEFRELMGKQPELANIIADEADRRIEARAALRRVREGAPGLRDSG